MRHSLLLSKIYTLLLASGWLIFLVCLPGSAQEPKASEAPKTAGEKFKNVQVLKEIPADQLIPSMQFITGALGVDCEFCHVEHAMDKDDKKEKLTARKMIAMELAINKGHFDGHLEVTCYTCHQGSPHPVSTPVLSADPAKMRPHGHDDEKERASLPSSDQVLDKYLTAVGGVDALKKITSRVQKGSIDAFGTKYPIEVYSQAPEKRVSISHPQTGPSVTAFNGEVGWLSMPGGFHQMSPMEQEAARIDAQIYLPLRLRELYREFRVGPGEPISGHETYLVSARGEGRLPLRLYFDQQSGLLLRQIRLAPTPLGRNPTQIDYADYRDADGVKIPFQWTLIRTNGAFTIHIDQVQQNIPIDDKLFVLPNPEPSAKP